MRRFIGSLLLLVAMASGATAATYHLNAEGTGDFPTIAEAIAAAIPGDSILLAAGLYLGAGNTQLDYAGKDIVIAGAGPEATILDCMDSGVPVLRFENGETRAAVLRDLTLRNNSNYYEPTGVIIENASPSLFNVHIVEFGGNLAWYTGGSVHIWNGSPLMVDVEIRDCYGRGGVRAIGGAPEFERVIVDHCFNGDSRAGGGMYFEQCAAMLREVTISRCETWEIDFNPGGGGGGVACVGLPSPTFDDCRFEENYAGSEVGYAKGGGGLACFAGAAPVLRRCSFLRNYARDGGGGLAAYTNAHPVLEDALFADNTSDIGGSILLQVASATLTGVTIVGSRFEDDWDTTDGPSAIHCIASSPKLTRMIVAFSEQGVGLWGDTVSLPVISCTDVFANPGGNYGGALADPTGTSGNISAEPLFCDPGIGDYNLGSDSPCLPEHNACGVLMGALPLGCVLEGYAISGHIADKDGLPLSGVSIEGAGYPITTNTEGNYDLVKREGWSGTLTPVFAGYAFTPAHRDYADLQADLMDQDFLSSRRTLHRVPADLPNLHAAFTAALSGDTILVAPGTYTGPDNRDLDFGGRELHVLSEGGSAVTVIDCAGAGRGFYLHSGEGPAAHVEGFTIANGKAVSPYLYDVGGGLYAWNSSPTLRDLRFMNCSAEYGGGLALEGSTTRADSIVVIGCTAERDGAGIFVTGSNVILRALTLVGNSTPWGGGGLALKDAAKALVERAVIVANSAAAGGAIYCRDLGNTLVMRCSDAYANSPDNYGNCPDPTGTEGNIAVDPVFCDPAAGDFTLHASSPCAAANSDCNEDLGYFGVGCADPLFTIAGHVRTSAGEPLPGVQINRPFYPEVTDADGAWGFAVRAGWSGSVVAVLPGYDIIPAQIDFSDVQADYIDQDFMATRVSLRRVPQDYPTIQDALAVVADLDTVLVAPGTYSGQGFTAIDPMGKDARIIGEGGSAATVIDCGDAGRAFIVRNGESKDALIQGFTIMNGYLDGASPAGAGIRIEHASPTLRDLVLGNCRASASGGGLYLGYSQSLVEDVTIRDCQSFSTVTSNGGGIRLYRSQPTLRRVLLAGNFSHRDGGGIFCEYSSPTLEQVTLVGNSTNWGGGGIGCDRSSSPVVTGCLVSGNTATAGGGIYSRDASSDPVIACSDVFANPGGNYGGTFADQTGLNGNISADPLFCDPAAGDYGLEAGSPCLPSGNGCGVQMGAYGEGCTGTAAEEATPAAFAFAPPQPNPFNPKTTLRFALPKPAAVELAIFDVSGRRVARLVAGDTLPAGQHAIDWEGRDESGRALPSGVYFARFAAAGFTEERKLVLLR